MGSASKPVVLDSRSDEEILADLQTFKPVNPSSERNIWAFWDRGIAACKPWCQRNIISWVRRHGRSWTVRVLDMVDGSPNHYSNYIPNTSQFFPEAFLKGSMAGTHAAPHAADLVRLPLLYLHGGIWVDVGFMLFRSLDDLCWDRLEDPTNPLELAGFRMTINDEISMFWNGLIAARKGCIAVKHWHDTFLKLWEGRDSTQGMYDHELLRHLPRYEVPSSTGKAPAFQYGHYVDYLIQMFCLERIRHLNDPTLAWDGPTWFSRSVLLFECVSEVYWAQHLTHWDGRKQFDMLSRKRDGTDHDEGYKEANEFVQAILDTSSTMKLSHGIVTEQREYLARIWDEVGNEEADIAPGTFAAYLRWASENFNQTRTLVPLLLPVRDEALLTGGLLEAVGTRHHHWDG
ncbi:hypothetical protein FQN50_002938 [Emmonsiellopsis sp. PD_5]|nr:hypothetical protein FQN50_002938 [Emmonsiellopsis sp. PD_5]